MSRLYTRLLTLGLALSKQLQRREPVNDAAVRHLLVAHYLLLGDTILLAPLLATLAQRFPQAKKTLLVRPAALPLFRNLPWGFRAIAYDPRRLTDLQALRAAGPFDLAYILGDNRYAWLARAAGARWIIGFANDTPAWKNWMVDIAHPYPMKAQALADMMAGLAGATPAFATGDWPIPTVPSLPTTPPTPYVILHVGASTPLKLWPKERWQALAADLAASGFTIAWSAGPGEDALVNAIDGGKSAWRYCGSLDLAQLWHLLTDARLLVSPDTGIAHLGKITGVPTIALFGPGSANIYGAGEYWRSAPYRALSSEPFPCRDQHLLFRRETPWVQRCGRNVTTCHNASSGLIAESGHSACMSAISLETVIQAAHDLLGLKHITPSTV